MLTPRFPRRPMPQPGSHPGADLDTLHGDRRPERDRRRSDGPSVQTPPRTSRSGRALLLLTALAALVPASAAAGAPRDDGDHAGDEAGDHAAARPHVTLEAGNDGLTGPSEMAGGLVDVTVTTEAGEGGDDIGHSVYIARIADGSTLADVAAGGTEALTTLLTFVGGAGTVHDGATVELTLDLEPGNYVAIDNVFLPEPTGVLPFVVGAPPADEVDEPEAEGTVQIGPGMLIAPPPGFDGGGTWRFENGDDTLIHEALIVGLPDGVGVPELVAWANDGRPEPAPFEAEFAGAGPLSPGGHAWLTLPELEPGNYALLCYVPFEDGLAHLSDGMIAPFTVSEAPVGEA